MKGKGENSVVQTLKGVVLSTITGLTMIGSIRILRVFDGLFSFVMNEYRFSVALTLLLVPPVVVAYWMIKSKGTFSSVVLTSLLHVLLIGFWAAGFEVNAVIESMLPITVLSAFVLMVTAVVWWILKRFI